MNVWEHLERRVSSWVSWDCKSFLFACGSDGWADFICFNQNPSCNTQDVLPKFSCQAKLPSRDRSYFKFKMFATFPFLALLPAITASTLKSDDVGILVVVHPLISERRLEPVQVELCWFCAGSGQRQTKCRFWSEPVASVFPGCGGWELWLHRQRRQQRRPHRVLRAVVRPLQESGAQIQGAGREGRILSFLSLASKTTNFINFIGSCWRPVICDLSSFCWTLTLNPS